MILHVFLVFGRDIIHNMIPREYISLPTFIDEVISSRICHFLLTHCWTQVKHPCLIQNKNTCLPRRFLQTLLQQNRIRFYYTIISFTTPHTHADSCLIIRLYKLVHFYLLIPIYLWGVTEKYSSIYMIQRDMEIDNNNKNFFVICSIRCSYHSFGPVFMMHE